MAIRKRPVVLAGVVAVGALALAGCSDSGSNPSPTTDAPKTTTNAPVDNSKVSPPNLVNPPVLKNATGARRDVTIEDCKEFALGDKAINGSVTNSGTAAADYVVTVSWVNGSDVMGRGFALVKAAEPGKKTDFTVKTKLTKAANGCTVNVMKAAAA